MEKALKRSSRNEKDIPQPNVPMFTEVGHIRRNRQGILYKISPKSRILFFPIIGFSVHSGLLEIVKGTFLKI